MKTTRIIAAALALCMCGAAAPAMLEHEAYSVSAASLKGGYSEVTSGWLTFRVYDDHAEAIDCSEEAEGAVIFPAKVNGVPLTAIGGECFDDVHHVTSVDIPETVTEIYTQFSADTELETITVSPDNPAFTVQDGVLYDKAQTKLLRYPPKKAGDSFTVPDTVSEIGDRAFMDSPLQQIVLPDSVQVLGKFAFLFCKNLTEINLPEGLTVLPYDCFAHCNKLEQIRIPASVTDISNAFSGCESLTRIEIPEGVTELTTQAFTGCAALKEIILPSTLTTIKNDAFQCCTSLTEITIPDSVTSIGYGAFEGCSSLTSVHIPDGLTKCSEGVFGGCTSMQSFSALDGHPLFSVRDGVLFDASGTTLLAYPAGRTNAAYRVPDGVTEIGGGAFRDSQLVTVTFPDSLKTIGDDAFYDCSKLVSVVIPASVETLEGRAFCGCTTLESVEFEGTASVIGYHCFTSTPWLETNREKAPLFIVNNMLIADWGCTGDVVIPDGVVTMADDILMYNDAVNSVYIPDGVETIGIFAFSQLPNLCSIRLPSTIKCIGHKNGTYLCGGSKITEVELPEGLELLYGGFSRMPIKKVTIPSTVTLIRNAFWHCENLEEVTILSRDCEFIGKQSFINSWYDDVEGNLVETFTGVIRGYAGSTAEAYAKQYGYRFEALPEDEPAWGDIDGNGSVELVDVILLNRNILGMEQLSAQSQKNADVNGDSAIDSTDSLLILKSLVSLVTLPVQS